MAFAMGYLLLDDDNSETERELRATKRLLTKSWTENQILKIDSFLGSLKITDADFIRNKRAYVKGIILKSNDNKSYKLLCDDFNVIDNLITHYGLNYGYILGKEVTKIILDIQKYDPENKFPIIAIEDSGRVIGIKYGENLDNSAVCNLTMINYILKQFRRPEVKETECTCSVF